MSLEDRVPDIPDVDAFIERYGEAEVQFDSGLRMPLPKALEIEGTYCTAEDERRQDPGLRIKYLAGRLSAAGSLLPEHAHLLADRE